MNCVIILPEVNRWCTIVITLRNMLVLRRFSRLVCFFILTSFPWMLMSSNGYDGSGRLDVNLTRNNAGDVLDVMDRHTDCASVFTETSRMCLETFKPCNLCRCTPPHTTFIVNRKQCMSKGEIASFSGCQGRRYSPRRPQSIVLLSHSKRDLPQSSVIARHCQLPNPKVRNPQFYSRNGTWIPMSGIHFSLEEKPMLFRPRFRKRRRKWKITFTVADISQMELKYRGQIGMVRIVCQKRSAEDERKEVCLFFKIAGSLQFESAISSDDLPTTTKYSTATATANANTRPTAQSRNTATAVSSSGSQSVLETDDRSGNSIKPMLIITPVLVLIILVLVGVIAFIYCRRRKASHSSAPSNRPSVLLQTNQKLPKSSTRLASPVQSDHAFGEDHIYATIPETTEPPYSNPKYEELENHNPDTSYETLEQPDVQYVEVLSDFPTASTR